MTAGTAKNWTIDKAPKRLQLFGEKTKKIESAQHIIEFPGGAVEVCRCEDGSYWAHIIVNQRQFADGDGDGLTSARGVVIGSRLDVGKGPESIDSERSLEQVAVLIRAGHSKGRAT